MAGFSPALPFRRDSENGFALTQSMIEVVRQNFKNLVLTNPGERVMLPDFGVGIRMYLFEMNNADTKGKIITAINEQTAKYMPYLSIAEIDIRSNPDMIDQGEFKLSIFFYVDSLDYADVLSIVI